MASKIEIKSILIPKRNRINFDRLIYEDKYVNLTSKSGKSYGFLISSFPAQRNHYIVAFADFDVKDNAHVFKDECIRIKGKMRCRVCLMEKVICYTFEEILTLLSVWIEAYEVYLDLNFWGYDESRHATYTYNYELNKLQKMSASRKKQRILQSEVQ